MQHAMKRLWDMFAVLGRRRQQPGRLEQQPECRIEHRLPAHGAAAVRLEVSGAQPEAVNLLGISERGVSFRSALSIAPEQAITVETGEDTLEAVVRHVYSDGQEFVVGAEIRWRNGVELESLRELEPAEVDKR